PIADKLTQGAVVLSLCFRYPYMIVLMVLFVVKEGFMGIMGIIMLRKGKMLDGAKWFGKVCTAVLYVVMFLLILFPQLPESAANGMILLCGGFMLYSFGAYIPVFWKMGRDS
ncbi:CDP-alcohol phosphatidyltransferase family protein, partial [Faecalicatena contorta]